MNRRTMSSAVWQIARASVALVVALGPVQAEGAGRLKGLKISVTAAVPGIDVANFAVTANTVPVGYTGTGFSSGPWVRVFWGHPSEFGHSTYTSTQLALSSPGSWRGSFSHVFPDSGSYTVSVRSCCGATTITTGTGSSSISLHAQTTVTFPGPHIEICSELPDRPCGTVETLLNNPKFGPDVAEFLVGYLVNYGPTFAGYLVEYVTEVVP